ncbi:hypothetical protein QMK17_16400 [Rhodococcus sp. G-MC3]|uniref:hypothetical protein n=1 Tax=Rhodococcus sp. G-MC3 TaxID=3046209 RepID=UPI0024BBA14D|nr:hypothetical protein [Rhodococcus sp. G-MC3]MDJ0394907.1 hypothetical protein [Rhodococcus sp. G-MC3]
MASQAENPTENNAASGTVAKPKIEVPAGVLSAVKTFVGEHGGTGNVVLQPLGRVGTRVTLVGADGVLGDQVVANNDIAHALIEEAGKLTESEWDRELVSSATPAPGHHRKMAGWVARQTRFPKARNAALEN